MRKKGAAFGIENLSWWVIAIAVLVLGILIYGIFSKTVAANYLRNLFGKFGV